MTKAKTIAAAVVGLAVLAATTARADDADYVRGQFANCNKMVRDHGINDAAHTAFCGCFAGGLMVASQLPSTLREGWAERITTACAANTFRGVE